MTGKERGDLEIKYYVVMQKPQPQATLLPPPRTLIMDYTMTHIRFGCSHVHPSITKLTYLNHPDPIAFVTAFIPLAVDTTGRMYDEFIRLLFLYAHREASALANELTEESDQFLFLRVSCFANLKGAVGLIMTKTSAMRISIPLDLSSRPCIPLPCFIRSRRPTPLLAPSLVLFPPFSA